MKKLKTRLKAIWLIMSGKYNHFIMINVDDKNLVNLLQGNDYDVDMIYSGLQPYVYYNMIKAVANTKDDIDMVLMKANFEANAFEKYNIKQ